MPNLKEVRQITTDEFNRCVAADAGAVNLPEGAVDRPPRLGLVSAAQGHRFQRLREALLLAEVVAQQAFVVEDNRTAAVRVDHRAVVVAASSDLVAVPPESSEFRSVAPANDEMRSRPALGDPAVPCGFVLAAQPHIGEGRVNAVAYDPAIPKPQFVDAVGA